MAKKRLVWTKESKLQLQEIFGKLYAKFKTELRIAAQEPGIGVKTEIDEIRGLISGNYILCLLHKLTKSVKLLYAG